MTRRISHKILIIKVTVNMDENKHQISDKSMRMKDNITYQTIKRK